MRGGRSKSHRGGRACRATCSQRQPGPALYPTSAHVQSVERPALGNKRGKLITKIKARKHFHDGRTGTQKRTKMK